MLTLANLFLFLFMTDGFLSVTASVLSGNQFLAALQIINALITLLLALTIYIGSIFDQRLPKIPLLPFSLFCIWATFGGWPINNYLAPTPMVFAISMVQINMAVLYLLYQRSCGKTYLIPSSTITGSALNRKRSLKIIGVHLLLSPLFLVYVSLASISAYADSYTAQFVRIKPSGVYMADRTYERAGKSIRLTAMVHIGNDDYYRQIADSLPTRDSIILAEGVSDSDGLMKKDLGYGEIAKAIGLASQKAFRFPGNLITKDQFENIDAEGTPETPHIVQIDADLNIFQTVTINFLNGVAEHMSSDLPLSEKMIKYNEWANTEMTPETMVIVMNDILHKRNLVVIEGIKRALKNYDTIVIPWGALHMPEIELYVTSIGFKQTSSREFMSIPFASILSALLSKKEVSTTDSPLPN